MIIGCIGDVIRTARAELPLDTPASSSGSPRCGAVRLPAVRSQPGSALTQCSTRELLRLPKSL